MSTRGVENKIFEKSPPKILHITLGILVMKI